MKKYIIPTTDIQVLTATAIMFPSSGNERPEPTMSTPAPMRRINTLYV